MPKSDSLNIRNFYQIIDMLNSSIFWKDKDGYLLGCNKYMLNIFGIKDRSEIIGKSEYDYLTKEEAERIRKIDELVLRGIPYHGNEYAEINGVQRVYLVSKSQLFDDEGNVIGVIGTAFDITAEKKAESLQQEINRQQIALQEQEKFSALARNVAHDIKSPLTAMRTMIGSCSELEEEKRIMLYRASESMLDIANNLIANYQIDQPQHGIEAEPRQALLVSDLLVQLLSEKKVQYSDNKSIRFEITVSENAQFAFIRTQKSEFRRAISNLINNAVDALKEKKDGKVTVRLTSTSHAVMVSIEDNGKGMSAQNAQKMERRRYFTEGKEDGHGLGLQQVWGMLESNRGRLAVQSELEQGTTVILTFSRIAAAKWIAQGMYLTPDHTIVILDDDQSIHDAWNMHFAPLLSTYPKLRLRHFTQGNKALSFINGLAPSKKDSLMLLSDYELLHQPRNGIEIIQASKIKQSILVTSHYTNPAIRDTATKLKIKILPKQMASIIPIHVE
jgi:PAS domain S-box-containing protein